MKNLFLATMILMAGASYASSDMGPEASEIFQVMTHPQVKHCLNGLDSKLTNVAISKAEKNCRGILCTEYKIAGNKVDVDIPSVKKTVITIKGKLLPGTFNGWIQTYECKISGK